MIRRAHPFLGGFCGSVSDPNMKYTYTARIFQEADGFHWSPESLPYLDARGRAYGSRSEALRSAYSAGYTHAVGSAIKRRRTITGLVSLDQGHHTDHARALEGRPL
jgi:hypothetical protein